MVFSSADGWADDKNGRFTSYDSRSCGYYLDAYSRTTLTGDTAQEGNHQAWGVFGWIDGYLTAYNAHVANGKESILGSMTINDARRWIAAWCRDNPSKDVMVGIEVLIRKLNR